MKKIAFLSFVAALGGILFGYDTAVISGTISAVGEQFRLDAMAKGWYVGCALVGSIAGVAVAGWLSDRFGRKPTMLFSSVLFSVSAIGCAFCMGFTDLVIYRIIGGVGIGIVSIVSPVYISEISPERIRGAMVGLYQLAITMGFVLAYLVNYLLLVNLPHVKGLVFVSVFLVYIFAQAISISAVVFVLLSEMYPNKVRGVAMSVAGFALWVGTYLIGQFTPWCMATLGSSGTFYFFAAMCVPYMLIMWRLVPETTGKSLEEIEAYWK